MNNGLAKAKYILSKCKDCLGCNRLEDRFFPGLMKCEYYRDARGDVFEKYQYGKQRDGVRKGSYYG